MAVIEIAKIQVRRGQELQTGVPQLDAGEFGWAEDTQNLYIGKRISEGANSDDNTRILTEIDLDNILSLLGAKSTLTLTTVYEYRDGVVLNTVPRLLQSKIDETVSLADFGVTPSFTATDITANFQDAIEGLFGAPLTSDTKRILKIPAGVYLINDTIDLPPHTILEGEGSGITKLNLVSATKPMFRTVDNTGEGTLSLMDFDAGRARDVSLKGMTLQHVVTTTNTKALLALNNVYGASIDDVEFTTTGTATYHSFGIGISMAGEESGPNMGRECANIHISNCKFSSLSVAVEGTGSVTRSIIRNNTFEYLNQGVKFHTINTTPAPVNSNISDNRFERIKNQAIFVGTSSNVTGHLSENNYFISVGNGVLEDDDAPTSAQSSVITFNSDGNKSVNDNFNRLAVANNTATSASWYFNPLIDGEGGFFDTTVFRKTLYASTQTEVTKLYLTGNNQKINMDYKLFVENGDYLRVGHLLINVTGIDSFGSISDYYNFSYVPSWDGGDPEVAVFSCNQSTTVTNYLSLEFDQTQYSTATNFIIEYQFHKAS
jgi:hypothetical protein